MLPRPKLAAFALISAAALALGCNAKKPVDYSHPLEDGKLALELIQPADYPNFTMSQTQAAAISRAAGFSIDYLKKTSSKTYYPYNEPSLPISHDRALATCVAFKALCDQHAQSPMQDADLKAKITSDFDVYRSIGGWDPERNDYSRTVLFTGYYTPIYDASMTPDGEYKYPLYRRPKDLLNDPEGVTASRRVDGKYVNYYTRAEIEQGGVLKGNELVWLKSRWEAYVISVQGSAKLKLRDGRIYEVGYSGNNGFPYESPGLRMVNEGKIQKDQLSLKGLKAYFDQHPEQMDEYLSNNRRFVFFSERPGGPFGSLNEPVTPFATVATDKIVYPRGMPSFVVTQIPTPPSGSGAYNAWLMDQDAGGGIRAAGRADLYMGTGPDAEPYAGHQRYEGKFYYIALKEALVPQYLPAPTPRRGGRAVSTEATGN